MASETPTLTADDTPDYAMRKLVMQAKIVCTNSIQEIDTINGTYNMWPDEDDLEEDDLNAREMSFDLRLRCEAADQEFRAIIAALDTFVAVAAGTRCSEEDVAASTRCPGVAAGTRCAEAGVRCSEIFVEMDARQELALTEVHAIADLVDRVERHYAICKRDAALSTFEADRRCALVESKLEDLKTLFGRLQETSELVKEALPSGEQVQGQD